MTTDNASTGIPEHEHDEPVIDWPLPADLATRKDVLDLVQALATERENHASTQHYLVEAEAEVERLRDRIRQASECDEPLMAGGTDRTLGREVGPCGTCRGCTVRQRTYGLLDDRTETT